MSRTLASTTRPTATERSSACWRTPLTQTLGHAVAMVVVITLSSTAVASAQMAAPDPKPYQEAIDKIDFLVGEWRGQGWMQFGPDQRETFSSWEKVERKLNGSALLIEGKHFAEGAGSDAAPAHHALATISWSQKDGRYRFNSSLYNRDGGEFPGKLDADGSFVWEINVPGRIIRYVMRLDEQGRWVENGKISLDGGENWFPMFHMTLEPVGE